MALYLQPPRAQTLFRLQGNKKGRIDRPFFALCLSAPIPGFQPLPQDTHWMQAVLAAAMPDLYSAGSAL